VETLFEQSHVSRQSLAARTLAYIAKPLSPTMTVRGQYSSPQSAPIPTRNPRKGRGGRFTSALHPHRVFQGDRVLTEFRPSLSDGNR